MQYISSDTNVWIDFALIHRLDLPFRLGFTYCMSSDTVEAELLEPPGIREQLLSLGLLPLEIDETEFEMAIQLGASYKKLSFYDLLALAITKNRGFILLSGDGALRRAARKENIEVRGTLWILDQLLETGKIGIDEYRAALTDIHNETSGRIRLPREEILKRIARDQ